MRRRRRKKKRIRPDIWTENNTRHHDKREKNKNNHKSKHGKVNAGYDFAVWQPTTTTTTMMTPLPPPPPHFPRISQQHAAINPRFTNLDMEIFPKPGGKTLFPSGSSFYGEKEEEEEDVTPAPNHQQIIIMPPQSPASEDLDHKFEGFLDRMEDTIEDIVAEKSSSFPFSSSAPHHHNNGHHGHHQDQHYHYHPPSPPQMYYPPPPPPTPTYHYPMMMHKMFDYAPILLSLMPLCLALGAALGYKLNYSASTYNSTSPVTVNVSNNVTSVSTSTSSGGSGTNTTTILPILVFGNGTIAFPITLATGITTGITGITLGLGNLFGIINLGGRRRSMEMEEMENEFLPLELNKDDDSFNPIRDFFRTGKKYAGGI